MNVAHVADERGCHLPLISSVFEIITIKSSNKTYLCVFPKLNRLHDCARDSVNVCIFARVQDPQFANVVQPK